jgi:predicted TIM-barrel fold metal-dependent hydrolase
MTHFRLVRGRYNTKVDRRRFLGMVAPVAMRDRLAGAVSIPIVDTHMHLFDTARPQGVPWPDKNDAVLYKPALPGRYRKVTQGLGVAGAIEIECSPWLEDNQWVLDVAAKDSIIVGVIGDLEPGHPGFRAQLERFARNPLYRGIRYGNLWGRDLGAELGKPDFIGGLTALAQAGLALDTANPTPALMTDVARLTDRVPNLRIILDHLPQLDPSSANLRELGKRPQVYAKVSGVLRRVSGRVPLDTDFYRGRLDEIWDVFGPDRVIYGSDWPNSDPLGTYAQGLKIVQEYFHAKGTAAAERYFWKNSMAAYRWIKRDAHQPGPA